MREGGGSAGAKEDELDGIVAAGEGWEYGFDGCHRVRAMHSRCEQVRGDGESREVLQRPEERMWLPYKPLTEEATLSGIDRVYLNTDCTWASSPEQSRRALPRRVAERGVEEASVSSIQRRY